VAPFDDIGEVEDDRDRPGPDGDVGEDGMEGMTEPGAVHERLEVSSGFAEKFVTARDNLLKEVGDRLQPALLVDETANDVIEHRRLLSKSALLENPMRLAEEGVGHPTKRKDPPGEGVFTL
jgi:hypothetical protein